MDTLPVRAALVIGLGLLAAVLLGLPPLIKGTIAATGESSPKTALTIEVTGYQWWWKVRYLHDEPSRVFTTANEIHVPVGQPVEVRLVSADVIHSFWVPSLAGKTDLIPGQTNVMRLEASRSGVYRGQCAEFCGAQHANMAFLVVASDPAEFQAWWDSQLRGAPAPVSPEAKDGETAFVQKCGICHTVRGTAAGGIVGPDLTNLMQRRTIAAGTLPNNVGHLAAWIADPQGKKPGNFMPRPDLSAAELQRVIAFLQTLK